MADIEPKQTPTGDEHQLQSPGSEVLPRAERRRFSGQYKLRILEEVDRCTERGQVGALLRREGLYSSHLSKWRQQRKAGQLQALSTQKRGRKVQAIGVEDRVRARHRLDAGRGRRRSARSLDEYRANFVTLAAHVEHERVGAG